MNSTKRRWVMARRRDAGTTARMVVVPANGSVPLSVPISVRTRREARRRGRRRGRLDEIRDAFRRCESGLARIDAEADHRRDVVAEPVQKRVALGRGGLEHDRVDRRRRAGRRRLHGLVAEPLDRQLEEPPNLGVRLGDEDARFHADSARCSSPRLALRFGLVRRRSRARGRRRSRPRADRAAAASAGTAARRRRSESRSALAPTMSVGFGRQTSGAVRLSPCTTKPCCASPPMIRWITWAPAIASPFGTRYAMTSPRWYVDLSLDEDHVAGVVARQHALAGDEDVRGRAAERLRPQEQSPDDDGGDREREAERVEDSRDGEAAATRRDRDGDGLRKRRVLRDDRRSGAARMRERRAERDEQSERLRAEPAALTSHS